MYGLQSALVTRTVFFSDGRNCYVRVGPSQAGPISLKTAAVHRAGAGNRRELRNPSRNQSNQLEFGPVHDTEMDFTSAGPDFIKPVKLA